MGFLSDHYKSMLIMTTLFVAMMTIVSSFLSSPFIGVTPNSDMQQLALKMNQSSQRLADQTETFKNQVTQVSNANDFFYIAGVAFSGAALAVGTILSGIDSSIAFISAITITTAKLDPLMAVVMGILGGLLISIAVVTIVFKMLNIGLKADV